MTSPARRTLAVALLIVGAMTWVGWSWSRSIKLEEAAIGELVSRGYTVVVDASSGRSLRAAYPPRWFCWLIGRHDFRNAIEVSTVAPATEATPSNAAASVYFEHPVAKPQSRDLRLIGHLPRLQRLTIENLRRSPDDAPLGTTLEGLKYCRQLRELAVQSSDFRDSHGLPCLRYWQEITTLDFRNSSIDNAGLADIIRHCPRLETLVLHGTGVDDAGFNKIDRLRHLVRLDVTDTNVSQSMQQELQRKLGGSAYASP